METCIPLTQDQSFWQNLLKLHFFHLQSTHSSQQLAHLLQQFCFHLQHNPEINQFFKITKTSNILLQFQIPRKFTKDKN
jgi:hypothetical protein